ncbi:ABC-type multidrug transport system, ATPase and permease component [Clostridium collagenovorans DSM 3089]|uniref:ABC-type multidrug transport system, ATPase and permease component n=1 Tax=Clostridium collagenovorans DSM 3089 TaxID=1121306 RepID=A0A1M5X4N5_9CLOT|nr:ABC transporter ATP-binding protein [Clostridium collagenovorans]SHH94761.1 ABC-type multidrug transport system, ATPase and permease component [Clostridium collagenovorans DSM 3089]
MIKFLFKYLSKEKYIILLSAFLTLIISFITILIPQISKNIFDKGILSGNIRLIIIYTTSLLLIYFLKSLINVFSNILSGKVSIRLTSQIKKDLYNHILKLPISFFDDNRLGYFLSRVGEVDLLSGIFSTSIFSFIISFVTGVASLVFILRQSPILVIAVIVFAVPFYIITNRSMKKIKSLSTDIMEKTADANGKIQESFQGIMEIKQNNYEVRGASKINKEIDKIKKKTIKRIKVSSFGSESLTMIVNFYTSIIALLLGIEIVKGNLTVGDYFALAQYAMFIYAPIQQIATLGITIQPSISALKRITELMGRSVEIEESRVYNINEEINNIVYKSVNFKYLNKNVINNLDLQMKKNEVTVISGKNGSGKSTVIKLLLGFYDNYEGDIIINNKNLKSINIESLRSKIGIVSQKIFLFAGTVEENIKFANENLNEERFEYVCSLLDDSIFNKIQRRSYMIAEGGRNLSGGQIQKIAIARALLKDSDVYIFDEATANIDITSKTSIMNIILSELKDKIVIIITHDKEIIDCADNIYSLDLINSY